jgi:hypothetical protein
MRAGQISVDGSTLISDGGANPGRPVLIKNPTGGVDVYLGDSATDDSDGFLLSGGESVRVFVGNEDLYGYTASAQTIYWIAG